MNKYLTFVGGVSNKFWEINLKTNEVSITYGRIGIKNPVNIIKEFSSKEEAKKYVDKKIREKLQKGYLEG